MFSQLSTVADGERGEYYARTIAYGMERDASACQCYEPSEDDMKQGKQEANTVTVHDGIVWRTGDKTDHEKSGSILILPTLDISSGMTDEEIGRTIREYLHNLRMAAEGAAYRWDTIDGYTGTPSDTVRGYCPARSQFGNGRGANVENLALTLTDQLKVRYKAEYTAKIEPKEGGKKVRGLASVVKATGKAEADK